MRDDKEGTRGKKENRNTLTTLVGFVFWHIYFCKILFFSGLKQQFWY